MPEFRLDDTSSREAFQFEALKEGDLRLRDLKHPEVRPLMLTFVISIAASVLAGYFMLDVGLNAGGLFAGALWLAFIWVGLLQLDMVDCILREDAECRRCSKEISRWEGDA